MTTIATDGKSMAGDGVTTCNGHLLASPVKVHRTSAGEIFGACGLASQCERFRKWMLSPEPRDGFPAFEEDFFALVLRPNGSVYWIDKHNEPTDYLLPAAIGSGSEYAIGAMLAGKSPVQAVEIASKRDLATAGNITVLHLEEANG